MATKYEAVHQSPNGPGDSRPTALQVVKDENLEGKLAGKVIFITGCSSGIGIETARALFATGATLYLAARDLNKAKAALPDLITSDRVHILVLDLNSLDSVRACAADFLSKSKILNIFIANAGVICPEGRTADGFETQFGTNHLAHFLLFNLLKPNLLASASSELPSRAILLTSLAHRYAEPDFDNLNLDGGAYNDFVAYGASKTFNLWTANEIDRRYKGKGLRAFGVHPGGILTNLTRHLPQEVAARLETDPVLAKILKTPQQGAATTVWAATAKALAGKGGKYVEDCQISRAWTEADGQQGMGYSAWAFDEEKEDKLWKKSLELVGLKDDA